MLPVHSTAAQNAHVQEFATPPAPTPGVKSKTRVGFVDLTIPELAPHF